MVNNKKIIAVLPAYNAAKTLKQTVEDISRTYVDEIILVDDASKDNTVEVARNLGLKVFAHPKNLGYGANQKTCYAESLKAGADIVVMVHPDHQYDPKVIPHLILPLLNEECDAVFGSRMMVKNEALKGGMPWWKFLANIFLTEVENLILGLNLTEYHSGFRAYSKKVLETLPLEKNSNGFVFDSEIIVQLKVFKFKIQEIPIKTRYFKEASQVQFIKSVQYGLSILRLLFNYILFKLNLSRSRKFIGLNSTEIKNHENKVV